MKNVKETLPKNYHYVGTEDLSNKNFYSLRGKVSSSDDVLNWAKETEQVLLEENQIIVTFVIDLNKVLWIADRHSEHYVCAKGKAVLAAGEITFQFYEDNVEVVEITNQSTGYCPEPTNWDTVEEVMNQVGVKFPYFYTTAFIFRLCESCEMINIVKDLWFVCAVCEKSLNEEWNLH